MPPATPGYPDPPGFASWDERVVKVRTRHRSQRAAEDAAERFRRQAANVGRLYLEDAIEVWSRDDLLVSKVHDFSPVPWQ